MCRVTVRQLRPNQIDPARDRCLLRPTQHLPKQQDERHAVFCPTGHLNIVLGSQFSVLSHGPVVALLKNRVAVIGAYFTHMANLEATPFQNLVLKRDAF